MVEGSVDQDKFDMYGYLRDEPGSIADPYDISGTDGYGKLIDATGKLGRGKTIMVKRDDVVFAITPDLDYKAVVEGDAIIDDEVVKKFEIHMQRLLRETGGDNKPNERFSIVARIRQFIDNM